MVTYVLLKKNLSVVLYLWSSLSLCKRSLRMHARIRLSKKESNISFIIILSSYLRSPGENSVTLNRAFPNKIHHQDG